MIPDKETARQINKAYICTQLKISPREYEKMTVNDINLISSYLNAIAEKQQIERKINNW